jgi:hypothetical protein
MISMENNAEAMNHPVSNKNEQNAGNDYDDVGDKRMSDTNSETKYTILFFKHDHS